MIIDFIATIDTQRIKIQVPRAELNDEIYNLVAYEIDTKFPIAFGESEEQYKNSDLKNWDKVKDLIVFETMFRPETSNHDFENMFFEYYTSKVFLAVRKFLSKINLLLIGLDWYDYTLWIKDYEKWPVDKQEQFEYMLQIHHNANRLSINGRVREIPMWKRRLEKRVRLLLVQQVPLILPIGLMLMARLSERFWFFPIIALVLPLVIEFLGKIIWMVSMRKILPVNYLKLFASKLLFQFITQKLVAALLKEKEVNVRQSA